MSVIAVAQRKGGAGKTTLAVQLAVAWATQGKRVGMLDVDPQGSLAAWGKVRQENARKNIEILAVQGWRLGNEIDRMRRDFDIVIIDTPPHADTDARVATRASQFVVIPVQASPMDLWAITPTLELAKAEKRPTLLVLNRLPSRGKLIDVARQRIASQGLELATATLGNRTAFAASMMDGAGVAETSPGSPAGLEILALAAELLLRPEMKAR